VYELENLVQLKFEDNSFTGPQSQILLISTAEINYSLTDEF